MDTLLPRRWWTFAIRAFGATFAGIAILTHPDASAAELARWLGVYALIDGAFALGAAVPLGDPGLAAVLSGVDLPDRVTTIGAATIFQAVLLAAIGATLRRWWNAARAPRLAPVPVPVDDRGQR